MNIEEGWRFCTADFSILAGGGNKAGHVRLVRDPEQRDIWLSLPEDVIESDECPLLYAVGRGRTLEEAIVSANLVASHAMPLSPHVPALRAEELKK